MARLWGCRKGHDRITMHILDFHSKLCAIGKHLNKAGFFIRCPVCGEKTRTKIRDDSILIRYLLYCPKCKAEFLVNIRNNSITILKRLDAKTQSR